MRAILCSVFLITTVLLQAQDDRAAIMSVIDRFFNGLAERDTAAMARTMTADGIFYAVPWQSMEYGPRAIHFSNYLVEMKRGKEDQRLLERYWDPQVRIEDRMATVWTEYDFHVDGRLSHCGSNVFNMVKASSGWLICGGVFNMRSEDCPESPLGPVE